MNYFKEYDNMIIAEVEQKKRKEQNRINCTSDYTYEIFEQFIMESLPKAIEHALKNKKSSGTITYNFSNIVPDAVLQCNIGVLEANHKKYGTVIIDEFIEYLRQIPQTAYGVHLGGRYFDFNLKSIIQYYYEELERIEYQTGKSR